MEKLARALTLLLTYAIKAIGLIAAARQLLFMAHPEALALEVSAFMMAGAQVSETLMLGAIDRFMGNRERKREASGKERDK